MQQLRNLVAAQQPGTKVALEIYRNGKSMDVTVEIGKREGETAVAMAEGKDLSSELGMHVSDLTPELAATMGLATDTHGVVVTEVDATGIAAHAGLQVGDTILDVQGVPTPNTAQFEQQISRHDLAKGVRLLVKTGSAQHFALLIREK